MINITMLGTSCMVPTKERGAPGIYAEIKGKGMLFDCGEGTQRQMNIAGISRTKVRYIFISHWHADHMAGLLGLVQTIGASSEAPELDVYGPNGTKELFRNLMHASLFENRVNIKVHELNCPKRKAILKTDDFTVEAINLYHNVPTLGFRLSENDTLKVNAAKLKKVGIREGPALAALQQGKDLHIDGKTYPAKDYTYTKHGKSMTYVADTGFTQSAVELAKDTDLLICEATYTKKHEDRARDHSHLTSEQSAQIASMSNAGSLLLTHFSQRYKTLTDTLEEARVIYPKAELAHDLLQKKL